MAGLSNLSPPELPLLLLLTFPSSALSVSATITKAAHQCQENAKIFLRLDPYTSFQIEQIYFMKDLACCGIRSDWIFPSILDEWQMKGKR